MQNDFFSNPGRLGHQVPMEAAFCFMLRMISVREECFPGSQLESLASLRILALEYIVIIA